MKNKSILGWSIVALVLIVIIVLVVKNWDKIKGLFSKGDNCKGAICDPFKPGFDMDGKANTCCEKKKEGDGNTNNEPPSTTTTTGGEVGKKVYAKSETVHIRETAEVNDGWINNRICNLPVNYEPAPTVTEVVDKGAHRWFKIKVEKPENCEGNKYGYVREDVVVLK